MARKRLLDSNGVELPTTRERILSYVKRNPSATVRAIQAACQVSAPSLVHYHLQRLDVPSRKKKRTCVCPTCDGKGRVPIGDDDGDEEVEPANERRAKPDAPACENIRHASTDDVGSDERTVFVEEGIPGQYIKLRASGDLTDDMLEALEEFVKRQRKRLGECLQHL